MDDVMAQTLQLTLDTVERVDRMLANAEARRNNVLLEIDRHRATLIHAFAYPSFSMEVVALFNG